MTDTVAYKDMTRDQRRAHEIVKENARRKIANAGFEVRTLFAMTLRARIIRKPTRHEMPGKHHTLRRTAAGVSGAGSKLSRRVTRHNKLKLATTHMWS